MIVLGRIDALAAEPNTLPFTPPLAASGLSVHQYPTCWPCHVSRVIGQSVEGLEIGQRVSGEGHLVGKDLRQSRVGKFHLDPQTRGIGVNEKGAFAQYLRLPAFNVIPLSDTVCNDIRGILDPLGNAASQL